MNIDQLKQKICKQLALIDLIERSRGKALTIATSEWYGIFGNDYQKKSDLAKQNAVTQRLANYLQKLTIEKIRVSNGAG